MTLVSDGKAAIIRTERGLTIAGTRITIYDVLDHLKAGWTPPLILHWLPLTEEQLNAALQYIDVHRDEVEAEYQTVLQIAEENREYWEEKNRRRFADIANLPPQPGKEAIYAKLQAWKAKLGFIP
ncbi:MAG TPA: DUF433 domain-containing protein [Nostocaceae cyanobacterium]|nr:DUF433 domain-containing protein [Nostocaceae cyanobacterium]